MTDLIYGVRIIESAVLSRRVQVRFPRSCRRRIRQKWARDATGRFHAMVPDDAIYQTPIGVIMHPRTAALLREALAREKEAWERKWR